MIFPNDHELASASSFEGVALVFGVVVEYFSAVGKELARSEDMLDPEVITKAIEGRPDALERYASSTNSGKYVALGETAMNGRETPLSMGTMVTSCFERRVERHHETVVVAAHDLILAPMTDTSGDPTPGPLGHRTEDVAGVTDAAKPGGRHRAGL